VSTLDLSLNRLDSFELQVPKRKNLGGNDPLIKVASNSGLGGEKQRDEDMETIPLHFSDGIWQQVDAAFEDQFGHFSHSRQGNNETTLTENIRSDRVYYNKQGMLVVREELKGRFVDGLF